MATVLHSIFDLPINLLVKKFVNVQLTVMQTRTGPGGYRRFRLPEFVDNRHMNVARLSALRTGYINPHPRDIPGTHFCYRLSRPQVQSAAGGIKSTENRMTQSGIEKIILLDFVL